MKLLDNCVMIIMNILSSSRISMEFMMRNTILASMIGVIINHFITFPPTQTCSCFVLYLEFLATQHCSSLPWNITTFYVKNVVRIAPPLKYSWYSDTPHHHHFSWSLC